ncbi:hypothetical protein ACGFZB_00110 [Streptomyces cinerochromogenes]|uniref:Uncharacterized protein n=1 Tax=Streptomyces cinerochromogenes TaxID=66422 RepID=A0ABW7AVF3_9ACTN
MARRHITERTPAHSPGPAPSVQAPQACVEFGAAGCGAVVVVLGPGEVVAEGLGPFRGERGGEEAGQVGPAFRGVALFAEHDVEPVGQRVPGAGPGVVRGERGRVQRAGPFPLGRRGGGAVRPAQVLQQRLHHVPRQHLTPVQAGVHALGIPLPEHPAPAAARIETRQEGVQVVRELPHRVGELIHSHRPLPPDCRHSAR